MKNAKLFSYTTAIAVLVGGIIALWAGDTVTGILFGTIIAFVFGWAVKSDWVAAMQSIPHPHQKLFHYLKLKIERYARKVNDKRQKRAVRYAVKKAIKDAKKESILARKGSKLLLIANGYVIFIALVFIAASSFLVVLVVFADYISFIGESTFPYPVLTGILFLILFGWSFALLEITFIGVDPIDRDFQGLEYVLYKRQKHLKKHEKQEQVLKKTAITYLERVVKRSDLTDVFQKYVQDKISLVQIIGIQLLNSLYIPIFLLLVLMRAMFLFANHNTRMTAVVSGLFALTHLSVSYYLLGGILWNNPNFWLSLVVAMIVGGFLAGYICRRKEQPFTKKFSKPSPVWVKF